MIYLGGRTRTAAEGELMARQALESGAGLAKLKSFIGRQGGDADVTEDYSIFPQSSLTKDILADEGGFVQSVDARAIGLASQHTGAGRATKEDKVDLSAGIVVHKKVGDKVNRGERLATVFCSSRASWPARKRK